jgi:hypothetical protein
LNGNQEGAQAARGASCYASLGAVTRKLQEK